MAREATITQEQVNAAAEAMVGAGQKPTNRAILDKLGSGSMATVVKLLQNWKAGQVRASTAIDDVVDPDVAKAIAVSLTQSPLTMIPIGWLPFSSISEKIHSRLPLLPSPSGMALFHFIRSVPVLINCCRESANDPSTSIFAFLYQLMPLLILFL